MFSSTPLYKKNWLRQKGVQAMCLKSMHSRNTQENEPIGKQRGKTIKTEENREKEQMWVHRWKPLIHKDKILLRAGVHLQQKNVFFKKLINALCCDNHGLTNFYLNLKISILYFQTFQTVQCFQWKRFTSLSLLKLFWESCPPVKLSPGTVSA